MQANYINPNPQVFEVNEIRRKDAMDEEDEDPLDSLEIFGVCRPFCF